MTPGVITVLAEYTISPPEIDGGAINLMAAISRPGRTYGGGMTAS
jgi:hypothetical protein